MKKIEFMSESTNRKNLLDKVRKDNDLNFQTNTIYGDEENASNGRGTPKNSKKNSYLKKLRKKFEDSNLDYEMNSIYDEGLEREEANSDFGNLEN